MKQTTLFLWLVFMAAVAGFFSAIQIWAESRFQSREQYVRQGA